ncbi:hypothetical protein V8G54_010348, partial [Vigna mungo]
FTIPIIYLFFTFIITINLHSFNTDIITSHLYKEKNNYPLPLSSSRTHNQHTIPASSFFKLNAYTITLSKPTQSSSKISILFPFLLCSFMHKKYKKQRGITIP